MELGCKNPTGLYNHLQLLTPLPLWREPVYLGSEKFLKRFAWEIFSRSQKNFSNGSAEKSSPFHLILISRICLRFFWGLRKISHHQSEKPHTDLEDLFEKFFRGRRKISQTGQQKKAHFPPSSILGSQKRSHTDLKDLFEIFLRAQKNFSNGSAEKAHLFPQKTITQKNFSTRSAKKKVVLRWW